MRAVSFYDIILLYFAFPFHGGALVWDRYYPSERNPLYQLLNTRTEQGLTVLGILDIIISMSPLSLLHVSANLFVTLTIMRR